MRAAFARTGRDPAEPIALEGEHLLAEALRSGIPLRTVFVRRDPERHDARLRLLDRLRLPSLVPIVELTPPVFDSAVETESPQGIAALLDPPHFSFDDLLRQSPQLIVIAAGLQDPGNFGTLIRSVEAFGASGVVAFPGTVSVWNGKVLRASAGSVFRVPVVAEKPPAAFAAIAARSIPVYAAVPGSSGADAVPCSQVDWTRPAALLIGNEGSGLSQDLLDRADQLISIPTPGPVESLNAAIAASVLLYEAARQRSRP